MTAGNPSFIAAGWGEPTKAIKLPLRICDRIQELKEDSENADDILNRLDSEATTDFDMDEVIELLQEALHLKPNAGGAIKAKIRQVLELLGAEDE